ncbi:hypothetical protein [Actinomadura sp. J1-007]|uniref:hypothetical protein n=1 Tax=Actinomadura sp. J1-007 TaxID=2661913 RepID=UPI001F4FA93C|nr:hypothetical protein [Actinomadura sp. J1-007]
MSALTSLAQLQASAAGVAQPLATVRHCHLSDAPLVLVPLKLAGEAAAPLAVMLGSGPDDPSLLIVAQPRNRDLRFAFAAELAKLVLNHIETSRGAVEELPPGKDGEERIRYSDAPQFLVPNRGGVGFLRMLGRSTRFRSTEGPYAVEPAVPVLGRWLTWLADRHDRPGSSLLMAMTEALRLHWATGQSALEDGNLAALVGWIDPPDGLDGPAAAARAEDPVTTPPAGPVTDPTFDNEVLAPPSPPTTSRAGSRARRNGSVPSSPGSSPPPGTRCGTRSASCGRCPRARAWRAAGNGTATRSPTTTRRSARRTRRRASTRPSAPPSACTTSNARRTPTTRSGRSTIPWSWPSTACRARPSAGSSANATRPGWTRPASARGSARTCGCGPTTRSGWNRAPPCATRRVPRSKGRSWRSVTVPCWWS